MKRVMKSQSEVDAQIEKENATYIKDDKVFHLVEYSGLAGRLTYDILTKCGTKLQSGPPSKARPGMKLCRACEIILIQQVTIVRLEKMLDMQNGRS